MFTSRPPCEALRGDHSNPHVHPMCRTPTSGTRFSHRRRLVDGLADFNRRSHRRRGAAVVEFAMLVPVFLTLLLGALEAGCAISTSQNITSAIREGGRLAAMDWSDVIPDGTTANAKVTSDIKNFLEAAGVPEEDVRVSITSAEASDYGQAFDLEDVNNKLRLFRISVEIDYDDVSAFPSSFMGGETIKASLVFRSGSAKLVS